MFNMFYMSKKNIAWWLGLIVAIATALLGYLTSSCTTSTSLSITADEISNPNINFTDSTRVINPFKK